MKKIVILPDWECGPSKEYIVTALGGEDKLRKDAMKDVLSWIG